MYSKCHFYFWLDCKSVIVVVTPTATCRDIKQHKVFWRLPERISQQCLFEVFVPHESYRVALTLLVLLGPHDAVWFSDRGTYDRIRRYNVGGFVCQEQEANYVNMLLLRRGCTFITHSLQRQWRPVTSPLFFRSQQRQRRGNPVTSRYWALMKEN